MDYSTDYFALSKGHSAGAMYVSLLTRGGISEEELGSFYKHGTALARHPSSSRMTSFAALTWSLGHGFPTPANRPSILVSLPRRLIGPEKSVALVWSTAQ